MDKPQTFTITSNVGVPVTAHSETVAMCACFACCRARWPVSALDPKAATRVVRVTTTSVLP